MPESMNLASLSGDLKTMLLDAAAGFESLAELSEDALYERIIRTSVSDMFRVVPRTLHGSIDLVAEQAVYDAPPAITKFCGSQWGAERQRIKPWSRNYNREPMPRCFLEHSETPTVVFDPPPSASQISAYGTEFRFSYHCRHEWQTDGTTTLLEQWRESLLLRCLAEAMRLMALDRTGKSGPVRVSVGGVRQGQPGYLYHQFLKEWLGNVSAKP